MESWAQVFMVVALIAATMVFGDFAGPAAGLAKAMFVVCLALAIMSLIRGRKPRA